MHVFLNIKMNILYVILFLTIINTLGHCERDTDENLDIWFEKQKEDFNKYISNEEFYLSDDGSGSPLLLSEYIKRNDIETARRLSTVEPKDIFQNISSHAGFITVDKEHNSNLWFWYFPSEHNNTNDTPLIIWLQGQPGVTSLFGLFEELGPFKVVENNTDFYLEKNPHSWHIQNSLLFIDNPVGTGFSFTDNDDGYPTDHIIIAEQLHDFIIQFLQMFPELQNAPLYIAGESYAARFIPSFAKVIHKNNPTAEIKVNLKGLVIENGVMSPESVLGFSSYLYNLGFVDDDQAAEMKYFEDKARIAMEENDYFNTLCYFNAILRKFINKSRIFTMYNFVDEETNDYGLRYKKFVRKSEIREALHIGNVKFSSGFKVYKKLINDLMSKDKSWMEESLEHYKVLLFSGQMNMIIPYPLAVKTYRNMKWSKSEEYLNATRKAWYEGRRVIGYTKSAGNFMEVFFRNAGHLIGMDQPKRLNVMINSFTRDIPLETD